VLAEDVPLFKGTYGVSRGQQAVKLETRILRSKPRITDPILTKQS
jgi:hypothetical protein